MDFSTVLAGTISGITTASLWAFGLWLFNRLRNHRIEKALQQSFQKAGVIRSGAWFGVTLRNTSPITVVVRDVRLHDSSETEDLILTYRGPCGSVLPGRGCPSSVGDFLASRNGDGALERGFVRLPVLTDGYWVFPDSAYRVYPENRTRTPKISACLATIEYQTVFGTTRVLTVEASSIMVGLIDSMLGDFIPELQTKKAEHPEWFEDTDSD